MGVAAVHRQLSLRVRLPGQLTDSGAKVALPRAVGPRIHPRRAVGPRLVHARLSVPAPASPVVSMNRTKRPMTLRKGHCHAKAR